MKGIVEMSAKFSGKCAECYGTIREGDEIYYNKAMRKASHKHCPAPVVKDYMAGASKWGAIMGEDMARRQSGKLYFLMGFVRRFAESELVDNATNSAHNQAHECLVPAAEQNAFIALFVERYRTAYKAAVTEWETKQEQHRAMFGKWA